MALVEITTGKLFIMSILEVVELPASSHEGGREN